MNWKKFFIDTANDSAFVIGSTGTAQILRQIARSAVDKPESPPNLYVPLVGYFLSFSVALFTYFIQFIGKNPHYAVDKPEHSEYPYYTRLHNRFIMMSSIAMMWNFFLIMIFAIDIEINGQQHELNTSEFIASIIGSLAAAIVTNASVRAYLWGKYCPHRNSFAKKWDVFSEFWNKYAILREIMSNSETVHNYVWGTDTYASPAAVWIRHGISLAWGLIVGFYSGHYFYPATKTYKIFPEGTQAHANTVLNTFDVLFPLTTFIILTIHALRAEIEKNYSIALGTLFGALLLAIPIRNYFYNQEIPLHQPSPLVTAIHRTTSPLLRQRSPLPSPPNIQPPPPFPTPTLPSPPEVPRLVVHSNQTASSSSSEPPGAQDFTTPISPNHLRTIRSL